MHVTGAGAGGYSFLDMYTPSCIFRKKITYVLRTPYLRLVSKYVMFWLPIFFNPPAALHLVSKYQVFWLLVFSDPPLNTIEYGIDTL